MANEYKERPILFSDAMVRAILEGRKTQTRRVVKLPKEAREVRYWSTPSGRSQPGYADPGVNWWNDNGNHIDPCPYGQPGDRLWVREAWRTSICVDDKPGSSLETPGGGYGWPIWYAADDGAVTWRKAKDGGPGFVNPGRYRHARFMPRWASRILLEITGIRVERLQDISEADAIAEGLKGITKDAQLIKYGIPDSDGFPGTDNTGWPWRNWEPDPRNAYRRLWESINGPNSWNKNPWVWAIEFKRIGE